MSYQRGGLEQQTLGCVDHLVVRWMMAQLEWLQHYDTVQVLVDNQPLPSADRPDHWKLLAPMVKKPI